MIFNVKKAAFGAHSYAFTGQDDFASQGLDFELALDSSGTLTLLVGIPLADLCLVAGGKPGDSGASWPYGGVGGEVVTATSVTLPAGTYTVTVGASDQDTVLAAPDGRTWTARSGYGSSPGRPGDDGVLAWNDPDTVLRAGWIYGSGGGNGSVLDNNWVGTSAGLGGSVGTASDDTTNGKGGIDGHANGYPGLAKTGQGGGGGRRAWTGSTYSAGTGGSGGSGVVLIRKHKEANT